MIRFTKNVEFDEDSWDYGNSIGVTVSVGERDGLMRHAVQFSRIKTLEPAVYADEPVRAYLDASFEGSGERVCVDEEGRAFVWEWPELKPAVTRRLTVEELEEARERATDALHLYLERVYQTGLLLAEGRIETAVDGADE